MITTQRKIQGIYHGPAHHWVGDGFRVRNYFPSGNPILEQISPFLMLDYAAPHVYKPNDGRPRGVGPHPHRGFETVTVAFEGSVAHHDSAGNAGVIHPGDVQWMTAGRGVLHKEYHEKEYSHCGGPFHMMQIWVNLPASQKMCEPRYQELTAAGMGQVTLPNSAGNVRIIAGEYDGVKGPAKTVTPINMWDINLKADGAMTMSFPPSQNTALMVLDGNVEINGRAAQTADFVLFENEGEEIVVKAAADSHLFLLNGEPIHEPIVQYGPFVMNTEDEIRQAFADFQRGKFGELED